MSVYAPSRTPRVRQARRYIIGPHTPEFSTYGMLCGSSTSLSGTWTGINDPVAVPFRLSQAAIVDQLGWCNGSAAGGNFDLGVYDSAWARLVSTGSTASASNNVWQFVDVAATSLLPNVTYYLAMSSNNTTANRLRYHTLGNTIPAAALIGVFDSSTDAFPLPNPLTNMAAATVNSFIPVTAIALRAPF